MAFLSEQFLFFQFIQLKVTGSLKMARPVDDEIKQDNGHHQHQVGVAGDNKKEASHECCSSGECVTDKESRLESCHFVSQLPVWAYFPYYSLGEAVGYGDDDQGKDDNDHFKDLIHQRVIIHKGSNLADKQGGCQQQDDHAEK